MKALERLLEGLVPVEKKKGDDDVVIDITEKGWFKQAVDRVKKQEETGRLDPDLNLTIVDTTDVFLPVGH